MLNVLSIPVSRFIINLFGSHNYIWRISNSKTFNESIDELKVYLLIDMWLNKYIM